MNGEITSDRTHPAAAQVRADQACERCHKHKVKCVPSGLSERCERCYNLRLDCAFNTQKRKRGHGPGDVSVAKKIAVVEDKLDRVFALLSPNSDRLLGHLVADHTSSLRPGSTGRASALGSGSDSWSQLTRPSNVPVNSAVIEEQFGQRLVHVLLPDGPKIAMETFMAITNVQAQDLPRSFQLLNSRLPFLDIEDMTLADLLSGDWPFLTAALIVATAHEHQLDQQGLAREFRFVISHLVIASGKRNTRVLQGLLVFMLHHHRYMDAEGPSVIMLFHICIGLLVDLGCDSPIQRPASSGSERVDREGSPKRNEIYAFLVSHYISYGLSFKCFNTKQRLPAAEILPEFIDNTVASNVLDIDNTILVLLQLCGIMEDIDETFSSHATNQTRCSFDESFTKSQLSRLERSVSRWHQTKDERKVSNCKAAPDCSVPYVQRDICSVDLTAKFVDILLYSQALQPKVFRNSQPFATGSSSGLHLSIHSQCLQSVKILLDHVVQLQGTTFAQLTFIDFILIISALTVLSRLSHSSLLPPGSDLDYLQIGRTFGHYAELIRQRLAGSPAYANVQNGKWSFADWFSSKCQTLHESISAHSFAYLPTPAFNSQEQYRSLLQSPRDHAAWTQVGGTYAGAPSVLGGSEGDGYFDLSLVHIDSVGFPWDSLLS